MKKTKANQFKNITETLNVPRNPTRVKQNGFRRKMCVDVLPFFVSQGVSTTTYIDIKFVNQCDPRTMCLEIRLLSTNAVKQKPAQYASAGPELVNLAILHHTAYVSVRK